MSAVHVNQIKTRLETIYLGKIDVTDIASLSAEDRQTQFISRALAAYALEIQAELTPDEAAKAITDGYDDNGLDAVHVSARDRSIYVVQSKWIQGGVGEPDLGSNREIHPRR